MLTWMLKTSRLDIAVVYQLIAAPNFGVASVIIDVRRIVISCMPGKLAVLQSCSRFAAQHALGNLASHNRQ